MKIKQSKQSLKLTLLLFLLIFSLQGQNDLTTDELFEKARKTAFDDDNYQEAIRLTRLGLNKSPNYLEMGVFLGRLYTFTDSVEKARGIFKDVLKKEIAHEDASLAYGNLEYWNDNSEAALSIINVGLSKHPQSEGLLLLKVKLLKDLKQFKEAEDTINTLLRINPKLTEARSLNERIKELSAKNTLGFSYDYVYFDKRYDDPWHLASIDYGRQTSLGSIITKVNFANRFNSNGVQLEVDLYPRLSRLFYMYVSGGISDNEGIFPRYRAGASLYSNLPAAFELDVGFRYLSFSEDTWIYTIGAGKYYKNYWFNIRTYLTPSNSSVSQSYALNVRYYFGGSDDYFSLKVGTGISPDDNTNSVLYDPNNIYKLKSNNINVGYRTTLRKTHVVFVLASLENQEYRRDTRGNQITLGVGYFKKF